MGYHVEIIRTDHGARVPIELGDASAALFRLAGWRRLESADAFARQGADGTQELLQFENGALWASSPSEAMLADMLSAARALNARVRGDELETYESSEKWSVHPDDLEQKTQVDARSRALYLRNKRIEWAIRVGLVAGPILLGLAYRWLRP